MGVLRPAFPGFYGVATDTERGGQSDLAESWDTSPRLDRDGDGVGCE